MKYIKVNWNNRSKFVTFENTDLTLSEFKTAVTAKFSKSENLEIETIQINLNGNLIDVDDDSDLRIFFKDHSESSIDINRRNILEFRETNNSLIDLVRYLSTLTPSLSTLVEKMETILDSYIPKNEHSEPEIATPDPDLNPSVDLQKPSLNSPIICEPPRLPPSTDHINPSVLSHVNKESILPTPEQSRVQALPAYYPSAHPQQEIVPRVYSPARTDSIFDIAPPPLVHPTIPPTSFPQRDGPVYPPIRINKSEVADCRDHYPQTSAFPQSALDRDSYRISTTQGFSQKPPTSGIPQMPPTPGINQMPPTQRITQVPQTQGYPQIPPTQGYPQIPPTQGYPQIPPTQGYPQIPPTQGYPQMPPTQRIPQVPPTLASSQFPPTPGIPQMQPTQEYHQMQSTQRIPQMQPTQEYPQMQPTQRIPQVTPTPPCSQFPPTTGIPQIPPIQGYPQIPPTQRIPQMPPTPGIPQMSSTLGLPQTPGFPQMPPVMGMSEYPKYPLDKTHPMPSMPPVNDMLSTPPLIQNLPRNQIPPYMPQSYSSAANYSSPGEAKWRS